MHPFSETKNADAVEKFFCLPYHKLRRVETDEMKILDEAIRAAPLKVFRSLDAEKRELRSQVCQRYNNFCTVRLDSATRVYIGAVCRNFSEVCMLLAYAQYKSLRTGLYEMDYIEFSRTVCPDGLPGEQDLKALWESLKVDAPRGASEDLLDYPDAAKSIQW